MGISVGDGLDSLYVRRFRPLWVTPFPKLGAEQLGMLELTSTHQNMCIHSLLLNVIVIFIAA